MKKILGVLILGFAAVFAADDSIFTGAWCVDGEDMKLEFIGKDSVVFSSDSDVSVNGSGKYSFDDTLLTARLNNSDMKMKIVYRYKKTDKGVQVITKSLSVNDDELRANPEPISLIRCKKQK
jgi:hypothetical protein